MSIPSYLKKAFIFTSIFLFGLLLFTYLFLKSAYFAKSIGWIISNYTEMNISIGSLSLSKEIVAEDVVIGSPEGPYPPLRVKRINVSFRLSELFKRKIDRIDITEPEMFIDLRKTTEHGTIHLPLSFNNLSIHDGKLTLQTERTRAFHISSINLLVKETDTKKAEMRGKIFLNEFNTTVPVEAVLDMQRFKIDEGYIDVTLKELENLTVKNHVFLKGKKISGSVRLRVRLFSEDRLGMKLNVNFKNVTVYGDKGKPIFENASGKLLTLFMLSEDYQYIEFNGSSKVGYSLQDIKDTQEILFKGVYDIKRRKLIFGDTSLTSLLLGTVSLKGGFIDLLPPNTVIKLYLKAETIPFKELKKRFIEPSFKSIDLSGIGGTIKTELTIKGSLRKPIIEGIFYVRGNGALSSPDGTIAAEGIDVRANGAFEFSMPLKEIEFTLNAEATNFELLIGRFYGNFKDKNINFSLRGSYSRVDNSIRVNHSELSFTDIGTILLSGEIENLTGSPYLNTEIKFLNISNKKAFDFFLRDTFKEGLPILSGLEIEGITSMMLSIRGTKKGFHVFGRLNINDMNIMDRASGLSLKGISLFLPIDTLYPVVNPVGKSKDFGTLNIRRILWNGIDTGNLQINVSLWKDNLIFKEKIVITLFGGRLILKDINYNNIFNPNRNLTFSLEVDNLKLDKLSTTLGIPRFSGGISGNIPEAIITRGNMITEGDIVLQVFGGQIYLSNLSISNIFSTIPSIKASIEVRGIDLSRLTDTFEFGHISGILNGSIRDLVITNGQLESFDVFLQTVKKKGVSQWISVEALKKISILGSGSPSSILDRGIYRFFKKYRYEKIGFRGLLRNDNFTLLGIVEEGGKQYIVKGGLLPPKVDVISYTQNISFNEMVKRLKRIKQVK